jgi:peptidoglycan/LPS O-acetylase OafA/YrhL
VFLLSGFLLSYLSLRELALSGTINIRSFYVRRLSRIIPLYLIALALYSFISDFTFREFVLNVFFVSKLFDAETVIPVGWSLELLVQYYVVCPVLVLLLVRSGRPITLTIGLIIVSLAARYLVLIDDPASYAVPIYRIFEGVRTTPTQDDLYYHLYFRATPFLLGFLLAWLVVHRDRVLDNLMNRPVIPFIIGGLGFILVTGSGFLPVQDKHSALYEWTDERFWLGFWVLQRFVLATGISLLMLCVWYARSRVFAPLRWLARRAVWGEVSRNIYGIYLFHPVFLIPAAAIGFRTIAKEQIAPVHIAEVLVAIVVAATLATLFARLLTRYVELPSTRWLRGRLLPP